MEPSLVAAERPRAMEIASALAARSDVTGVALFGSHARGSAAEESDVDLLVLLREGRTTPTKLIDELPEGLGGDDVSLSVFNPVTLGKYLDDWSRFALHLRREAVIAYDPHAELSNIIHREVNLSLDYEIRMQGKRFCQFEHMERFGERMILPLAQLYRLGRTLVFINLAKQGCLDFDRKTAFVRLKNLDKELADDVEFVEQLMPFYLRWRGLEVDTSVPFEPVGAHAVDQAVRARAAVGRLLSAAENGVDAG